MYQSSINGLTSMALDQGTKASLRKWGQLITVPGPFLKSREWRVQRSSCMCLTNLWSYHFAICSSANQSKTSVVWSTNQTREVWPGEPWKKFVGHPVISPTQTHHDWRWSPWKVIRARYSTSTYEHTRTPNLYNSACIIQIAGERVEQYQPAAWQWKHVRLGSSRVHHHPKSVPEAVHLPGGAPYCQTQLQGELPQSSNPLTDRIWYTQKWTCCSCIWPARST